MRDADDDGIVCEREDTADVEAEEEGSDENAAAAAAETWVGANAAMIAAELAALVATAPKIAEFLENMPDVLKASALSMMGEAVSQQIEQAEVSIGPPEKQGEVYRVIVTVATELTGDLPGLGEITTYVQVPFVLDIDLSDMAVTNFKVDTVNVTVRSE